MSSRGVWASKAEVLPLLLLDSDKSARGEGFGMSYITLVRHTQPCRIYIPRYMQVAYPWSLEPTFFLFRGVFL